MRFAPSRHELSVRTVALGSRSAKPRVATPGSTMVRMKVPVAGDQTGKVHLARHRRDHLPVQREVRRVVVVGKPDQDVLVAVVIDVAGGRSHGADGARGRRGRRQGPDRVRLLRGGKRAQQRRGDEERQSPPALTNLSMELFRETTFGRQSGAVRLRVYPGTTEPNGLPDHQAVGILRLSSSRPRSEAKHRHGAAVRDLRRRDVERLPVRRPADQSRKARCEGCDGRSAGRRAA
jgi:hypothetical protein